MARAQPRKPARAASPRPSPQAYWRAEIALPAAGEDAALGIIAEAGALGAESPSPDRLVAWFDRPLPAGLRERLATLGAEIVARGRVPGEDWVGQSRARQRPVRIGRMVLRPPWSRARPGPGGLLLVIDPARAFGTGSHESTRLVLGALLDRPPAGLAVLDVGTGSGVLALAALKLGARRVVALDIDPEAVAAAAENAARNHLGRGLCLLLGDVRAVDRRFPLVVANLTAPLLCGQAAEIGARVAPRGRLLLAGLLETEVELVQASFAAAGLRFEEMRAEGGWALLALRRHR